ncbi:hypothetical protein BH23PLA1_BH23PLA1_30220 [soil metagenome]
MGEIQTDPGIVGFELKLARQLESQIAEHLAADRGAAGAGLLTARTRFPARPDLA